MYIHTSEHTTVVLTWNYISYLACKQKLSTILMTVSQLWHKQLSQYKEAWMHSFNVCIFYNHYSFAQLICFLMSHFKLWSFLFLLCSWFWLFCPHSTASLFISTGFGAICWIMLSESESKGSTVLVIRLYIYSWY